MEKLPIDFFKKLSAVFNSTEEECKDLFNKMLNKTVTLEDYILFFEKVPLLPRKDRKVIGSGFWGKIYTNINTNELVLKSINRNKNDENNENNYNNENNLTNEEKTFEWLNRVIYEIFMQVLLNSDEEYRNYTCILINVYKDIDEHNNPIRIYLYLEKLDMTLSDIFNNVFKKSKKNKDTYSLLVANHLLSLYTVLKGLYMKYNFQHGDLSLDNMMIHTGEDITNFKMIDFAFSQIKINDKTFGSGTNFNDINYILNFFMDKKINEDFGIFVKKYENDIISKYDPTTNKNEWYKYIESDEYIIGCYDFIINSMTEYIKTHSNVAKASAKGGRRYKYTIRKKYISNKKKSMKKK
jgi:hypothetical protein